MKQVTGGCHCGNIQYQAAFDEAKVVLCHCEDCQKMSGAPYRGVVIVREEDFKLQGNIKNYIKRADSGNSRAQAFCPECGTHIYATSVDDSPKIYNVRLGTIDQKAELSPTIEIWCDSKLDWVPEIQETKKIAGQP